jgi:hypothetical protein
MRNNREYVICKDIALYMRLQYPTVMYRFDMAGLNLSIAQAGMNKGIQYGKGWPDMFIAKPQELLEGSGDESQFNLYYGLFIEIKKEGTKLYKTSDNSKCATPHLQEQLDTMKLLRKRGYMAEFACGFDESKILIDKYLQK